MRWSIPWGFVDAEEFPDIAACREALEESGIQELQEGARAVEGLSAVAPFRWPYLFQGVIY